MTPQTFFTYEYEHSKTDSSNSIDSRTDQVTTIKCHGKLVAGHTTVFDGMFNNEHPFKGRIVLDLTGVDYIDSAGLGALMRLKLHAMREGGVSVTYINMTSRVLHLLKIANLHEWFIS